MPRLASRLATLAAAVALVVGGAASAPAEPVADLTEVGTPITNVAIDKVAYGTLPDGTPVIYTVLLGSGTTSLHVIDLRERRSIRSVRLDGAIGSRDLAVAPDGTLYIATFQQGRLYSYDYATNTLTDLGRPSSAVTYLYGLGIHPDGTVFFGGYPTGQLFAYDPDDGTFRDYGNLSPDSQYLRSAVVWGDAVYAGLGTQRARLVRVDIASGAVTPIPLPAPYDAEHEVNQVTVRGDVAYVHLTASRTMLRYDLRAQRWLAPLGPAGGLDVSPVAPMRKEVYFVGTNGRLNAFSTLTGRIRETGAFPSMFTSRGFAWIDLDEPGYPGESLVMTDYIGRLWVHNPRTGESRVDQLEITGEPVHIRALGVGPDGRIWAGGLGSGGLSWYDPATGGMAQVPRGTVGQTDEMLRVGSDLYLGTYPAGTVLRYDPGAPFAWGGNPGPVANLSAQGQDRPMALAWAAGRLVIGTVPNYGQLAGAISVYDPATGSVAVDRGVAGSGSVVSAVAIGDVVYASTSKWAGLGIVPPGDDGRVFAYDPVTRTKLWEVVPYPGLPAVTELAVSPSGTLWGLTQGRLFELDPSTRQVVREISVPAEDWTNVDHVWSEGQRLAVLPDGTVYAVVGGQLLRADVAAGAVSVVTSGVSAVVLGDDGALYLSKGAVLHRLVP
ncbi:PQQ-binding-like beta-propeller repeat protein [Jiangella endophytica]|uniref:PQQ-binding-like beta-propeller repeat protein n=1 Tax=Jiangella endophytica TaxID=1623398 RepID=UPI000E340FDF|nr:PQQ-binding-like beta-propeller repeat protein [Jiangella endophytica]